MTVPPEQSGGQNSAYRSGCHKHFIFINLLTRAQLSVHNSVHFFREWHCGTGQYPAAGQDIQGLGQRRPEDAIPRGASSGPPAAASLLNGARTASGFAPPREILPPRRWKRRNANAWNSTPKTAASNSPVSNDKERIAPAPKSRRELPQRHQDLPQAPHPPKIRIRPRTLRRTRGPQVRRPAYLSRGHQEVSRLAQVQGLRPRHHALYGSGHPPQLLQQARDRQPGQDTCRACRNFASDPSPTPTRNSRNSLPSATTGSGRSSP